MAEIVIAVARSPSRQDGFDIRNPMFHQEEAYELAIKNHNPVLSHNMGSRVFTTEHCTRFSVVTFYTTNGIHYADPFEEVVNKIYGIANLYQTKDGTNLPEPATMEQFEMYCLAQRDPSKVVRIGEYTVVKGLKVYKLSPLSSPGCVFLSYDVDDLNVCPREIGKVLVSIDEGMGKRSTYDALPYQVEMYRKVMERISEINFKEILTIDCTVDPGDVRILKVWRFNPGYPRVILWSSIEGGGNVNIACDDLEQLGQAISISRLVGHYSEADSVADAFG